MDVEEGDDVSDATVNDAVRAWAQRCADSPHVSAPERAAWLLIAERGVECDAARARFGRRMAVKQCFRNAALTALGCTASDATGARYAEGFAEGTAGLWFHHAWVISADGVVIERTWDHLATRYIGVTFTRSQFTRPLGYCQLSEWPLGITLAPAFAGDVNDSHRG
jgi:hypothetical protein